MARRRYKSEISGITSIIPLRTSTRTPIRHQLYEGLRGAIQSGQLTGGVQLPSTRALAHELEISRSTVLNVYQRLLLEGYVEGRHGAGTYIAGNAPADYLRAATPSGLPPRGWQYSDLPSPWALNAEPLVVRRRYPGQRPVRRSWLRRTRTRRFLSGNPHLMPFRYDIGSASWLAGSGSPGRTSPASAQCRVPAPAGGDRSLPRHVTGR